MPQTCCEFTDRAFSRREARQELASYRRNGPGGTTRKILNSLCTSGISNAALLEIGGGIGVIHHELLEDVAREAVHVDASSAYLAEARLEAARRGHQDRVTFLHADFVDMHNELAPADIVILDGVVRCYPGAQALLAAAAQKCRHTLALSYPREIWYMRLAVGASNFLQYLFRERFRSFVHSVEAMNSLLAECGLRRVSPTVLFAWEVATYTRH